MFGNNEMYLCDAPLRKPEKVGEVISCLNSWRGLLILILTLGTMISMATVALAEKRVAFVVGIDTYDKLGPDDQLKNAVNDALKVASVLEGLKYEVELGVNLTRTQFTERWQQVVEKVNPSDTLVVFFSGHGVQRNGQNYLLPRDIPYIKYGREAQLKRESFSVPELLLDLRTGDREPPQVTLLILDACRNDPMIPPGYKSLATPSGLATIIPPKGTFIMYSADAGGTALDRIDGEDDEPLSLYTRTLVPLMQDPQLSLQELAVKVREKVSTQAEAHQHEQWPAYYDEIRGRFCIPGCQTSFASKTEATVEASTVDPNSLTDLRSMTARVSSESLEAKGGPRMVAIPGGTFLMGLPDTKYGLHDVAGPQHQVTIPAFELGETEVTFAEWEGCVADGSCLYKNDEDWGQRARPIINVSWNEARTYIKWLNASVGLTGEHAYRLPSEAEWEYVAKSGAKQEFWAGTSEKSKLGDFAVYQVNSSGGTAEVRSKKPNAFGLYDLSGNVWEWVEDCWHENYEGAPTDALAWVETRNGNCLRHVIRGGAWSIKIPYYLRSSSRRRVSAVASSNDIGFRLARTPAP